MATERNSLYYSIQVNLNVPAEMQELRNQLMAAQREADNLRKSTDGMGQAVENAGRKIGNSRNNITAAEKAQQELGRRVQNTAFQFQDLAVQIEGGTSPMRAMAQQIPQMLVGFGALGAAIGVAFAAMPLIASQLGLTATSLDDVAKASKDAETAAGNLGRTMQDVSLEKFREEYNKATKEVRALMMATLETDRILAESAARKQKDTLLSFTADKFRFQDLGLDTTQAPGASDIMGIQSLGVDLDSIRTKISKTFGVDGQANINKLTDGIQKFSSGTLNSVDAFKMLGPLLASGNEDAKKFGDALRSAAEAQITQQRITEQTLKLENDVAAAKGGRIATEKASNEAKRAADKEAREAQRKAAEAAREQARQADEAFREDAKQIAQKEQMIKSWRLEAEAITKASDPWDAYAKRLERISFLQQKQILSADQAFTAAMDANNEYLKASGQDKGDPVVLAGIKRQEQLDKEKNALLEKARAVELAQNADYAYSEGLRALNELKPYLSIEAYNAELKKLDQTLYDATFKTSEFTKAQQSLAMSGIDQFSNAILNADTNWRQFAANFLKQISAMIIKQQILNALSGTKLGNFLGIKLNADGDSYDTGTSLPHGVYSQPKLFKFADGGAFGSTSGNNLGMLGEAGPEAIVPLKRSSSGKLGVSASPVNITVNNNMAGAQVDAKSDGNGNITLTVERVKAALVRDIRTGGNPMDAALRMTYGMARVGT